MRDIKLVEDQKYGITNIPIAKIRKDGVSNIALETLDIVKDCEQIYISFDVDSLDSSLSLGTGTPVGGVLTVVEAIA